MNDTQNSAKSTTADPGTVDPIPLAGPGRGLRRAGRRLPGHPGAAWRSWPATPSPSPPPTANQAATSATP